MKTVNGPTRARRAALRQALWSLLIWAAVVLSAILSSPTAFGQTPGVFEDALGPGWENWSWGSTVSFANPDPAQGAASIRVRHDSGWSALYLHSTAPLPPGQFTGVRFWMHGGPGVGQRVRLVAFDSALEVAGSVLSAAACRADLNGDGLVDFADYLEFLNLYDAGC